MMRFPRDPNETRLHHWERQLISGSGRRDPMWQRLLCWIVVYQFIYRARRFVSAYRSLRATIRYKMFGHYALNDLCFAAYARCNCGSGLAYPHNVTPRGEWDCSAALIGDVDKYARNNDGSYCHPTYPFVFYDIKSDIQPSANGATTRPGALRVVHGALFDKYVY